MLILRPTEMMFQCPSGSVSEAARLQPESPNCTVAVKIAPVEGNKAQRCLGCVPASGISASRSAGTAPWFCAGKLILISAVEI